MVAELTALRDQIDDVDKALLNLLLSAWNWLPKSAR
nr:chorismate mutase/prephenate dehydrogenase [Salmonella sp. NCTC 7297]